MRLLVCALLVISILPLALAQANGSQNITNYQKALTNNITAQMNQTRENLANQIEKIRNQTEQIRLQMEMEKARLANQTMAQKLMEQQKQEAVAERLRSDIRQQTEEINETLALMKKEQQEIYEHQMNMLLAIKTIIAAQNELPEMPKNISTIAYQINGSIENTTKAEEKIQNRNALIRVLGGGDRDAAGEIESAAKQNQEKVRQINTSIVRTNYSTSIKSVLSDQILVLQSEQERLINISSSEKKNYGLIGWIWK